MLKITIFKKSSDGLSGIGCLYFQKKHNRLLATNFRNTLRVGNCDFKKNKYELFKEVDYITNFSGKIIHEMKNKILIGGQDVITILNNDNYMILLKDMLLILLNSKDESGNDHYLHRLLL